MPQPQSPEPLKSKRAANWAIGLELYFLASIVCLMAFGNAIDNLALARWRWSVGETQFSFDPLGGTIALTGFISGLAGLLIPQPNWKARAWPAFIFLGVGVYALLPPNCSVPASREAEVRSSLVRLRNDSSMLLIIKPELAKASREEWLDVINEENKALSSDKHRFTNYPYPGIETGIDPWGRKIIIEVVGHRILFRSLGRDGVDQHGEEDDIQVYLEDGKLPISK